MAGKRKSRKRRRPPPGRRPVQAAGREAPTGPSPRALRSAAPDAPAAAPRGYARSRARDDAARAALKPLRPGERPAAVTVGAIAAAVLALANLIALVFGYNAGEDTLSPGSKLTGSIVATLLLVLVAYGMWRARYWAVLGMQTLLGLTIVFCSLALIQAVNWWAFVLVTILLLASGTLFWFLVKAMARIQMPQRPGT
jgi:hypothetical protein